MAEITQQKIELVLDGDTLLQQLQQMGSLGFDANSGGRTRLAFSDDEKLGRDILVEWMQELDLEISVDRIGNIFGTMGSSDNNQAALMIGSHIDTVVDAGALDGCYGVLSGLAVVRAFRRADKTPSRPIVIAAFSNEEGVRYQPDMMGSLVFAGGLGLDEALDKTDTEGCRLGDELTRIGYAGELEPGAIRPQEYLEIHIEQGPVLETQNIEIGVVENLQGISWQRIRIKGDANHAGTTPTRMRHDAGWVAASIVTFLRELAISSTSTLATVGTLELTPNLINVIPSEAVLSVDLRDPDELQLQAAEDRLGEFLKQLSAQEGVTISSEQLARFKPVTFDPALADAIEASAAALGLSQRRMTSGAGHDAQMIARIAASAMIFVPSRDGISHNPKEHTDDKQLIYGAKVLLNTVIARLAN